METTGLHINRLANGAILSRILAGMNRIRFYDTPDTTHCERSLKLAQICRTWYQLFKYEHYSSIYVVSRKDDSGQVKWHSNIPAVVAAGMERHVRNLFISGSLITSKAAIAHVLQGLGFNYLELRNLKTIYFVGCTSNERYAGPSMNADKISSYFARRLPNLTAIVPSDIDKMSDGVDAIINKILLAFSPKLHTLVTGPSLLGRNPNASFANLTHVILHNTDSYLTDRFAHIAPASLKSLELFKACALFPWTMFGDGTDGEVVFSSLEELRLIMPYRGMRFVRQKISRFRLRFPKLRNIHTYGACDSYEDFLQVLLQAPVGELELNEELEKLKHLDPTFVRDLDSLTLFPIDPKENYDLTDDSVFVKMFDTPSKMTKLNIALNAFAFPEITTVKWHGLADVSLCFRSFTITGIEAFLYQLPKMKSFAIRMGGSQPSKNYSLNLPPNKIMSTSLKVFYFEVVKESPWDEYWLYTAIRRLPSVSIIYVSSFYRRRVEQAIAVDKRDITFMERRSYR